MNFRELINKIEEAEAAAPAAAPADPARAQYDKFRADDAKAGAVAQVKQLTKPNGNANYIDPKDGIIKYQENGAMGQPGGVKEFSYDWYKKGQESQFFNLLKTAGLEVIPVDKKSLFGSYQVAGVDPAKLATLGQQAAAPGGEAGAAQAAADDQGKATALAKLKQLNDLLAKLKTPAAVKEGIDTDIAKQLIESFGYTTEAEGASLGQQAAAGAAGFGGAKIAGKVLGKALPGVGLAFGAADAYDRAKKGDYVGAGMAGLSGLASLVPGVGTAAAMGLDAANIARDYKAGEFSNKQAPAPTGTTQPAVKGDPKVFALQQKLISKGAQIKADGIMGPKTQAAMKQYGIMSESVAESMADLRAKLAMIETEQQADEGVLGNAWNTAKEIGQFAKHGFQNPEIAKGAVAVKNAAGVPSKNAQWAALKAGGAVARNPVKTAAAATALGAGAGLALGNKQPATPTTPTTPTKPTAPTKPTGQAGAETGTTGQLDQATMDQINQLMSELSQFDIPEVQQGLVQARQTLAQITGDKNIGSADKAAAQAGGAAPAAAPTTPDVEKAKQGIAAGSPAIAGAAPAAAPAQETPAAAAMASKSATPQ